MIPIIILTTFIYSSAPATKYNTELTEYIKDFLSPVNKTKRFHRRFTEAMEMIPIILKYCKKYNVDPLRIAVLAGLENSWLQEGQGSAGEIGPLQIMPKWFKKEFDVTTLDGQIEAGVWWMSQGIQECEGDGARAYHWYAYAICGKVPSSKARFRERRYQRAVKKYRRGKDQK